MAIKKKPAARKRISRSVPKTQKIDGNFAASWEGSASTHPEFLSVEQFADIEAKTRAFNDEISKKVEDLGALVSAYADKRAAKELDAKVEKLRFEEFVVKLRSFKMGDFATVIAALKIWAESPSETSAERLKFLAHHFLETNINNVMAPPKSIYERFAELNTLMADKQSDYWRGPDSDKLQQEWRDLHTATQTQDNRIRDLIRRST